MAYCGLIWVLWKGQEFDEKPLKNDLGTRKFCRNKLVKSKSNDPSSSPAERCFRFPVFLITRGLHFFSHPDQNSLYFFPGKLHPLLSIFYLPPPPIHPCTLQSKGLVTILHTSVLFCPCYSFALLPRVTVKRLLYLPRLPVWFPTVHSFKSGSY